MSTWIPSAEAFGSPSQVTILGASGVPSTEAFGDATITHSSVTLVQPVGALSGEAFGTATQVRVLGPQSVSSREAFGTTYVNTSLTTLLCSGTVYGHGTLTLGEILLSGAFHGAGTLDAVAVLQLLLGGAVWGSGKLLWSGPLPVYGTGSLTAFLQLLTPPKPLCCPASAPKTFSFMQPLGAGDLAFQVTDGVGNNFSPISVTYALYQIMPGGYRQLRGPAIRQPVMTFGGVYYATGSAGECGQPGAWCIVWTWQRANGFPAECRTDFFTVQDAVMRMPCDPARKRKFGWGC